MLEINILSILAKQALSENALEHLKQWARVNGVINCLPALAATFVLDAPL